MNRKSRLGHALTLALTVAVPITMLATVPACGGGSSYGGGSFGGGGGSI